MLIIKVSSNDHHAQYDISQYIGNNECIIDGCRFFINNPNVTKADYWICSEDFNAEVECCEVNPNNVYFVTAEVAWSKLHYHNSRKLNFLRQFSKIFTCHPIYLNNVQYELPFLTWMINSNHGPSIFQPHLRDVNYFKNLTRLEKTKIISVFCSNQDFTEDHKLRLDFVKELKKHFGEKLDWYGNGINPLSAKWDGIAPYRYHIVLENQSKNNVITEKLYDAFLGLAFPIYYGAPNVADFFDPASMAVIDIADLNGSIKKIEEILETDLYHTRLPDIIKSKNKVTGELNVFSRVAKICNTDARDALKTKAITLNKVVLRHSAAFKVSEDLSDILRAEGLWAAGRKVLLYYAARWLRSLSEKLSSRYGA
jgi:hypothetical protein